MNFSIMILREYFFACSKAACDSSIVFTFGGLKVNTRAQVINTDGDPIPGIYAAGETMGTYYGTYTGATSVLKGAVFGRIAGRHAASLARAS